MTTETIYIKAVNDKILHIFTEDAAGAESFASERKETLKGAASVLHADSGPLLETSFLTVEKKRGLFFAVYDRRGNLLCEDWGGVLEEAEQFSEEEIEQMRAEGHNIRSAAERAFTVAKRFQGDEVVYGLGDKTGFLNKRGYEYMMWNSDNPDPHVENPTFQALYKSIPFFIVLCRDFVYGIFLDNTHRSWFDMGYGDDRYYSFGAAGGALSYYFIGGRDLAEVVGGYTWLTGRTPLPQLWTLGYHQSRWSYGSAEEVLALAKSFRKYQIPCDAIHLDIDYMDDFKVFTVGQKAFPDLKELSGQLAEMGIKLVAIIDPGTKAEKGYELYDTGIKEGYFARDAEGNVYQNVVWPGESVYPDFTSAKVRRWWGEQTKRLTDQGIAGIWNDMNEPASFRGPFPDDVVFPGDNMPRLHSEVHNVYGHLMAEATYCGLKEATGKRPFVITRACYSGSQKYACAWTGDNQSLWAHLQMSIPQLLNLGMSGMPFVGTDIGGFGANATPELLCRWIQASCFAPLFRNHSAKFTRRQEPWQFDEKTREINRKYISLRYRFLPYLYDLFREETETGIPILRPLAMHYQYDKNTWECNDEYLVGQSVLVAPVVNQGARARMVYLPEGVWVDYWTGERIFGGREIVREAPLEICPIYIKAGSIIPMREPGLSIGQDQSRELTVEYYLTEQTALSWGAAGQKAMTPQRYVHYQDNGVDFAYETGEYNLYEFLFAGNGGCELSVQMLHTGYSEMYESIEVNIR